MLNFKALIEKLNEKGIPLPLVRADGKASLTASFAWISFNWAILSQIGKVTKILGEVDTSAANYLFFGCLAAHLGRRMMGDGKKVEISAKNEE